MGYVPGAIAFFVALGILCGWLLYRAADRDNGNKWLWGIAGVLFNIFAVIAYRLISGRIVKQ